jgi:hypothetical protein
MARNDGKRSSSQPEAGSPTIWSWKAQTAHTPRYVPGSERHALRPVKRIGRVLRKNRL